MSVICFAKQGCMDRSGPFFGLLVGLLAAAAALCFCLRKLCKKGADGKIHCWPLSMNSSLQWKWSSKPSATRSNDNSDRRDRELALGRSRGRPSIWEFMTSGLYGRGWGGYDGGAYGGAALQHNGTWDSGVGPETEMMRAAQQWNSNPYYSH